MLLDRGDAKNAIEEFRIALIYKPDSKAIQVDLQKALQSLSHPK